MSTFSLKIMRYLYSITKLDYNTDEKNYCQEIFENENGWCNKIRCKY